MRFEQGQLLDNSIYVIINNKGEILACLCNEESAYAYAVRECFKFIDENDLNKNIFDELEEEECSYEEKLNIIHNHHKKLIKTSDNYFDLAIVEELQLFDEENLYD